MFNKVLKPVLELMPENNRLERIWVLAKIDFKSRFYYNSLGIVWALIKPVFEFLIYFTVFSYAFENDIPYFSLYLFLGLIIWYFFVEGTNKGITMLRTKMYLIENIPFNKFDLFTSGTLSALISFAFNFLVYLVISILMGVNPLNIYIVYLPILLITLCLLITGIALILATISIYIKDIQHLWDMIILGGFWGTPIVYDKALIESNLPFLIYLNPLSSLLINLREVVLYGVAPDLFLLFYGVASTFILFLIGYYFFNKYSYRAAERI